MSTFLIQAVIVFAVSFIVTYIMVPVSMWIARHIGAMDYPGERRMQQKPIPRAGGIALFAGFLAGCGTMVIGHTYFGWTLEGFHELREIDFMLLFTGISAAFFVGLVDDVFPLPAPIKFVGQLLAATVIFASGVSVDVLKLVFTNQAYDLGWVDYPITVAYLLVFANITNLIDGLDGLAAGIVAISMAGLLYLVMWRNDIVLGLVCIIVIAACLAFLRFNFHPARVFMGDSGSLLLGTLIGVISVSGVARSQGVAVSIVAFVMAGVPIVDTATSIVRRIREGKRIDEADMEHLHHRLVASGISHKNTVLILYGISAVLTVAACTIRSFSGPMRWTIITILVVLTALAIWRLGLFGPVLHHYYRRQDMSEPRRADSEELGRTGRLYRRDMGPGAGSAGEGSSGAGSGAGRASEGASSHDQGSA